MWVPPGLRGGPRDCPLERPRCGPERADSTVLIVSTYTHGGLPGPPCSLPSTVGTRRMPTKAPPVLPPRGLRRCQLRSPQALVAEG
jgi:hypothetical protein